MTDDKVINISDHRWIEKGSPEWQDEIMSVLNDHMERLKRLEDAVLPIKCSVCRKAPKRGVHGLYDLSGWMEIHSPFQAWRCSSHIPVEIRKIKAERGEG